MSRNRLDMIYPSTWWHDLWREGLVTGNGYTGANLYGGAKKEILQLGRHDFWYDGSEETLPDVKEAFVRLREKMDRKEYREASWEVVNALNERNYGSRLESHMPAARIVVEQKAVEGFAAYHRSLDMEKALCIGTMDRWGHTHVAGGICFMHNGHGGIPNQSGECERLGG